MSHETEFLNEVKIKLPPFCKIRMSGSGNEWPLQCVSFAADRDDKVKIISAVGASTAVKGFCAIFGDSKIPCRINLEGAMSISSYTTFERDDKEYNIHRVKLVDSWYHVVIISKDERLIPHLDPNSLWAKLKSTAFTTPMLSDWMPYITEKLTNARCKDGRDAMQKCKSFHSNAAMIYADDEVIDGIVSTGVREKALAF